MEETMKKILFVFTITLITLAWLGSGIAQEAPKAAPYHAWWKDMGTGWPKKNPNAKNMPLIQVLGNKFVDPQGNTVLFRGMAISDPDKIANQGHWNKTHFEKVKETGCMVVRIPIHPIAWRERTPVEYLKLIDEAIEWCTELKMYVMIDWHSIGNLGMELFQNPMYVTTQQETFEFWRTIASRYRGNNTVAFYELFNEPTIYSGQLGSMPWSEWKSLNEKMINLIRAFDKETIILVAGLDWAYDLTPLLIEPINEPNIGFVTHPYEHKRKPPLEPKWDENFGFAAATWPIVATEFGFGVRPGTEIKKDDYCYKIVNYLEGKGISWVCWVYDPEWGPSLLKSWDTYELTPSGEFFKKAMQGKLEK